MAYRLELGDGVAHSLRKVAREQLEAAAEELRRRRGPRRGGARRAQAAEEDAVGAAARPPGHAQAEFQAENRALRDAGRALSGARDADVMVETVEKLGRALRRIAALRAATRNRLAKRPGPSAIPPSTPILCARWPRAPTAGRSRAMWWSRASVVRTRAAGRRSQIADRDPTAENLHEWRKRVKDLWYQQRLLQQAWPAVLKAEAAEAKALSKLLGDDHDLAVLAELLGTTDGDPQDLRRR